MSLKSLIRTIPDYPKPGILFRDITTLLLDARGFREAVEGLAQPFRSARIDKVAGIEARGLILGGAVALELGAGFAPVRKRGQAALGDDRRGLRARVRHRPGRDAPRRRRAAASACCWSTTWSRPGAPPRRRSA